jgi:hypothetical protein
MRGQAAEEIRRDGGYAPENQADDFECAGSPERALN